jgi:hypothetical protein
MRNTGGGRGSAVSRPQVVDDPGAPAAVDDRDVMMWVMGNQPR